MNTNHIQCERTSNDCPSKRNCNRHESPRSLDFPAAALYVRRPAGSNACDLVQFINVVTTFKEEA